MSRANPATTHGNAGIAAWRFKLRAEIGSYEDCREFVRENDPDHVCAELGPQMRVLLLGDGHDPAFSEDVYAVTLYKTEIVRYYPDGTFSVDNGGWNTPTTSERLQAVVPEGFRTYHQQKRLGMTGPYGTPSHRWATRAKPEHQPPGVLWPLDHSIRIEPTTGIIVAPVPGAVLRHDDDGRPIVDLVTCGSCGRTWNDAAGSSWTPVPSGRCPFEYEHDEED